MKKSRREKFLRKIEKRRRFQIKKRAATREKSPGAEKSQQGLKKSDGVMAIEKESSPFSQKRKKENFPDREGKAFQKVRKPRPIRREA